MTAKDPKKPMMPPNHKSVAGNTGRTMKPSVPPTKGKSAPAKSQGGRLKNG